MARRSTLFRNLLVSVGLAALVPLAGVTAVTIASAYRVVSDDAYRYAATLGDVYATRLASRFADLAGHARSLAASFSAYDAIPAAHRRTAIASELRAAMERLPDVLAVWAQWEPGAIGDDPRDYVGSALSTPSGAFDATWYRSGTSIVEGAIDDAAYSGDFYTLPKASGKLTLIDPYLYSYTGSSADRVLETSLCAPILKGGRFEGVVGFDFAVDLFQKTVEAVRPFDTGYGILVTGSGTIVCHPDAGLIGAQLGSWLAPAESDRVRSGLQGGRDFFIDARAAAAGADSRVFFAPIQIDGLESPWFLALVAPKARVLAPARAFAAYMTCLCALGLILVASAIFLVARSLVRPIAALALGASRIAAGDLSIRVPIEGGEEAAVLAESFNAMAGTIQKTLSGLEGRVAERTLSLEEANAGLQRALADIRAAQEGMEMSAKMALLGRLTAGIAHELNTPIGAIRSSARYLSEASAELVETGLTMFAALPEEDRELCLDLARKGAAPLRIGDGEGDRRRRARLAARLEEAGAHEALSMADDIAMLEAFDLEEPIVACVARGGSRTVSAGIKAASAFKAASVVLQAAEKAARTVASLSTYARGGNLDQSELLRPAEDIEALLELYYGNIKSTVAVERSFASRDPVKGYRERLKEVWINLINNALQAMEYKGRLSLATAREGEWVVVSVSDSGPGIPEENRPRIFTPFFTTKPPGEGTGLGLDICKRIVEEHGGSISFETRPGRTTFTVRLRAADAASTPAP